MEAHVVIDTMAESCAKTMRSDFVQTDPIVTTGILSLIQPAMTAMPNAGHAEDEATRVQIVRREDAQQELQETTEEEEEEEEVVVGERLCVTTARARAMQLAIVRIHLLSAAGEEVVEEIIAATMTVEMTGEMTIATAVAMIATATEIADEINSPVF